MSTLLIWTIFVLFIDTFKGTDMIACGNNVTTTFVPSHEWQKVEDEQVLPPGLQIRVNLQTGVKEAKLADSDGSEKSKSLVSTVKKAKETDNTSALDPKELNRMLKNIKSLDASDGHSVKKKLRSYEELKQDFEKLQVKVKSDVEILTELIENFKKYNVKVRHAKNISSYWTRDEEIISVLVDLEYLVHQFDNAQEFAKMNGFSEVVFKSLNSSNSEIRSKALRLLGSATQSNPKVQIAALESGSINLLIKILTFDENVNVRSTSLFALSCLTRRFPAAQQKFITDGGLTAFAKVFAERKPDSLKLQIKIITLLHDLLFERKDIKMVILEENKQEGSKEVSLKEKLLQYERIDLEQKLLEQEWCDRISYWFLKQNLIKELTNSFIPDISSENINFGLFDAFEKIIDTVYIISDICRIQFQSNHKFVNLLATLRDLYSTLANSKSDDDVNLHINSVSGILRILTDKLYIGRRDEL